MAKEQGTAGEQVQEFRRNVDGVIRKQVDEAGNVSWPGMHNAARAAGLIFGSYAESEGRPHTFTVPGLEGSDWPSVWGVQLEGRWKVEGVQRLGLLAVVSANDRPDSLLRQWCFSGEQPLLTIDTIRAIDDPETIANVNEYIRSPHLTSLDVIGGIAVLSAEELASVQEREEEMNESDRRLQEDLAALPKHVRLCP